MATTISFEQSLDQLETIIQELERGQTTLEESLKLYDEGIKLVTNCQKELSKATLKVEELSAKTK